MSIYPRERISEALQDSANRGIAMLIAPAGFGKTEAVADAFGTTAHWIELSDRGVTVEGLARDIITAAAPQSLRALSPLLARAPDAENRAHLTGWIASRLRSVEQPIVLEDFQRACPDDAALAFVRDIIAATVPAIRWVLVSRETPELPIGTWLARDYMTLPITTDDLAFDVEESRGVAAAMGVQIADDALRDLVGDVAGWPLAVRLSLGAWERTRALPPLRIRTRGVLFDFIETEVWGRLSDVERDFFEAAAHLSELRPRILSAAGFPESRLSLEQLHRRLPLLSKLGNGAFRLHELFREFILERPQRDPEARGALAKRLARAIERFGAFEEAVSMSLRAEDWDGAIVLLARRGVDRIESGHRAEVSAALARFPRSYSDHPVITGLRGYALAIDGAYELAKREMEVALAGELDPNMRGPLALMCGTMAFNTRDYEAAIRLNRSIMAEGRYDHDICIKAAAALAMTCAIAGDTQGARDAMGFCASGLDAGSVEVRAMVRHRLAYAHLVLGEYALAEHYANESVQLAHSIGLESLAARAYSLLQNVASVTYADTLAVRRYAESCLQSAEACGERAMQIFALETLEVLACSQGDDELSESVGARLQAITNRPPPRNAVWTRFSHAVRDAGRGHHERAIAELRRLERSQLSKPAAAFVDAALAVLYASNDFETAETLLAKPVLATADRDFDAVRYLMYAQTFHALGHWLIGRGRAARRARMPNANDLAPVDAALVTVIGTICSTSRQTITARQLEQFTEPLVALGLSGYARFLRVVLAPASVHELTRTELEVLRALRTGGTTAEVADRLGKSNHTVLSHIKSACSKLGCSGRAAAVSFAVDQGWID
jgi:ATP/maltotriose-dependent transcriptional regulator MalT